MRGHLHEKSPIKCFNFAIFYFNLREKMSFFNIGKKRDEVFLPT